MKKLLSSKSKAHLSETTRASIPPPSYYPPAADAFHVANPGSESEPAIPREQTFDRTQQIPIPRQKGREITLEYSPHDWADNELLPHGDYIPGYSESMAAPQSPISPTSSHSWQASSSRVALSTSAQGSSIRSSFSGYGHYISLASSTEADLTCTIKQRDRDR